MMHKELVQYRDGETVCEAYVAHAGRPNKQPCVLIAHDWSGRLPHVDRMADEMAAHGYVGIAIDIYGHGNRGRIEADNSALMAPFIEDRALLLRRLQSALDAAASLPFVDSHRVAIVGYCFGGLCALDLARSADPRLAAAISIHGVLSKPPGVTQRISASVLVLHGWEDPYARPREVLELAQELTQAGADWQLHAYGHALHAFTAESLNDPAKGLAYHPKAAARARHAQISFLAETLASHRQPGDAALDRPLRESNSA
ncbi:dienelactone hydrolase family protein [Peristeroidobacter agariperforans]|uniref:dienelactone hydrolase family protein n=1 Tax=Peristeroidobacter agariperforans TaxID=268404 RepID=UPI00101B81CB|nr:dienelactone hydrolase family protein [Peristeroidobacter agariperforans]